MDRGYYLSCALLVLTLPARADLSGASGAPAYTAAGVVNAATQLAQTLAPNTIATLYGTNLSFVTHAVTSDDLSMGTLPTTVGQITVSVNGIPANLYYVSPGQINFLIPYTITAPTASIYVLRQGMSGPTVTVPLASASPGFFQWNNNLVLAVHTSGTLISPDSPAVGGEVIILFAAGLGRTAPDLGSGVVAIRATSILDMADFQILLNGVVIPATNTYYAGIAPGFSGLYQINLLLPDVLTSNSQIQIAMGQQVSPPGIVLSSQ